MHFHGDGRSWKLREGLSAGEINALEKLTRQPVGSRATLVNIHHSQRSWSGVALKLLQIFHLCGNLVIEDEKLEQWHSWQLIMDK